MAESSDRVEGTFFEFSTVDELLGAADALRVMGYRKLEAYTPYPIPELDAKLGIERSRLPRAVFVAAAVGCAVAFLIIWSTNAYDYPLNVGGRPLNSLPADIPIMFETTVLFGSLAAFALVFALAGLPRLHRPVFQVPGIESASVDHFWLAIDERRAVDDQVNRRMTELGALAVRTLMTSDLEDA